MSRRLFALLLAGLGSAGLAPLEAQDSTVGRTASVNGMQMYYEVRGEGPPLVLLHGFSGCVRAWNPHVAALAKGYRLIVPELRGHGRTTNPTDSFSHKQAALDVYALLDQLGIREFQAMGISSGGMTLLHMATRQPARISRMVLIGATPYFGDEARAIQARSNPDSLAPADWERYRRCHTQGDDQVRKLVRQFHAFATNVDDMNFTEPYLGTITARTLIVHGDRDQFFPVALPAMMYRAIPRSYLWIVPNGGHVPITGDRVQAFLDVVSPFLRGDWDRQP